MGGGRTLVNAVASTSSRNNNTLEGAARQAAIDSYSTNNNTSAATRASSNNNTNASGVDALLMASGATDTTASGTMSGNNNNNINPSRLASVDTRTTRTQSGKPSRSKGTKNFSNDELSSILELIEKVLPTGNDFWELVVELHKEKFPEMGWNVASIKKKNLQTGQ